MRSVLCSACFVLLAAGCGGNPDRPPTNQTPAPGGANAQGGGTPVAKKEAPGTVRASGADAKDKAVTPAANSPAFDTADPVKALDWLVGAVKGAGPGREERVRAVAASRGQKIRWSVPVKEVSRTGVILEPLMSAADDRCTGLRLIAHAQPARFTTFNLEVPAELLRTLSRGDIVTVAGTVEAVEIDSGATGYGLNVRLSGYAVTKDK